MASMESSTVRYQAVAGTETALDEPSHIPYNDTAAANGQDVEEHTATPASLAAPESPHDSLELTATEAQRLLHILSDRVIHWGPSTDPGNTAANAREEGDEDEDTGRSWRTVLNAWWAMLSTNTSTPEIAMRDMADSATAQQQQQQQSANTAINDAQQYYLDERARLGGVLTRAIILLVALAGMAGVALYCMAAFAGQAGALDTSTRGWRLYLAFLLFCGLMLMMLFMAYAIRLAELHLHFTNTVEERATEELLDRYQRHRQRQMRRLRTIQQRVMQEADDFALEANDDDDDNGEDLELRMEDEDMVPVGYRLAYEQRRLNRRLGTSLAHRQRTLRQAAVLDVDPTLLAPPPPTYAEANEAPPTYEATVKPPSVHELVIELEDASSEATTSTAHSTSASASASASEVPNQSHSLIDNATRRSPI